MPDVMNPMKNPRTPLRVALIGAGRWGRRHAEKIAAHVGSRLVAVVDVELERARSLAALHGGAAPVRTVDELRGLDVQAAVVASNAGELAALAFALVSQGAHVLVEKPVALEPELARTLVRHAAGAGVLLVAGFVERFQPALTRLRPGRLLVIRRCGPCLDAAVPVALDWMIHDFDLALRFVSPELTVVSAVGDADALRVRCQGPGGRRVLLHAHRGPPQVSRRLWLDGERVHLRAPLGSDPLAAQWAAFVEQAHGGPPDSRLATGADAVAALQLAHAAALSLGSDKA